MARRRSLWLVFDRSTVKSKSSWFPCNLIASPASRLVGAFEVNHAVLRSVRPKQAHGLNPQLPNFVSKSRQIFYGAGLLRQKR